MKTSIFTAILIAPPVFAACMVDPVVKPVVTSPYGVFRTVNGPTVHQGLDIVSTVETGERTRLLAAAQGEVIFAGFRAGGYGNMVAIKRTDDRSGDVIAYKHVRNTFPRGVGQKVNPNDVVGYMSGTGAHQDWRNRGQKNGDYQLHLHLEYLVKKNEAIQYEMNSGEGRIYSTYKHLGSKGVTDRIIGSRHQVFYTDPSPYFCNSFQYRPNIASLGRFRGQFKGDTKSQFNFVMTRLGRSVNIDAGSPPTLGEYSAAQETNNALLNCEEYASMLGTNAAPGLSLEAK